MPSAAVSRQRSASSARLSLPVSEVVVPAAVPATVPSGPPIDSLSLPETNTGRTDDDATDGIAYSDADAD